MRRTLVALTLATLPGAAAAQNPPSGAQDKAPWGALTDSVEAAEIVLRDVCLPGVAEGKDIAALAHYEHLVEMPPNALGSKRADRVWRMGSIRSVYAVTFPPGTCTTFADGPPAKLRAMAERTILARPEGFVRGRSGPDQFGQDERTIYCARLGDDRLVATIMTPIGKARRKDPALSSAVYRAKGWSELCEPGPIEPPTR